MEMLETLQNASSRMREDEWGREQGLEAECRIRVYKYNMHEGRDGMGKREAKRGCSVGWS